MRAAATCLQRSPRANANENPVHLEDEGFSIKEHEDWHREKEIS
jgi:hypothetical protein